MSARETLNRWVEAMQILCGRDDNPGKERRAGYDEQRQKMLDVAYAEVAAEVRRADADSFERYPWRSDGAPYDKGRDAAIEWVVSTLRRRAEVGEPDTPQGDPSFFQPGHVYVREHHGCRIEFHVRHVDVTPNGTRFAFGFRTEPCINGWAPMDSDDLDGWVDVTEDGGQ